MKAEEYFNKKAKHYHKERSSGFIGSLVAKEKYLVLKLLNPKKNEKILDAGCGSGYFSIEIKKLGAIPFGVDISKNMINKLKEKNVNGAVANIEDLNLNIKFDKILCAGALEFTNYPIKAIKSFAKHIKKDGIFVLVYPKNSLAGHIYRLFHRLHKVKIKLFSIGRIKNLIEKSGFKIVYVKNIHPISNVAMFKKE